ncbi:hypothetical protein DVH05_010444 [Phytophthora capsici]|nr:hypothetical protein DVH05_010444 [Phytophthora capsici]
MQGPGAGVFFNDLFQSLWNQGIMVTEKGFPAIDGTVRNSTGSTTQASSTGSQQQGQLQHQSKGEAATYQASAPTTTPSTPAPADQTMYKSAGTQTSLQAGGDSAPGPATPTPVSKAADSQQISTESSDSRTMGAGVIVLIALVAAAVVALAAIVSIRRRQKKMINAAKTPELSALAPLPTTIVDFRPHRTTLANNPNIL